LKLHASQPTHQGLLLWQPQLPIASYPRQTITVKHTQEENQSGGEL
jgi:hypothetical protein